MWCAVVVPAALKANIQLNRILPPCKSGPAPAPNPRFSKGAFHPRHSPGPSGGRGAKNKIKAALKYSWVVPNPALFGGPGGGGGGGVFWGGGGGGPVPPPRAGGGGYQQGFGVTTTDRNLQRIGRIQPVDRELPNLELADQLREPRDQLQSVSSSCGYGGS